MQPALLSYVAATAGFPPPDPKGPFTYLELGCGNGATLNVLAAANPESRFVGIDLNSAHIDYARNDASRGNLANVTYVAGSFEDIRPDDLPVCDFIAIHGAYSWLSPSAVDGVHAIVREKLRGGGLFFIDYLCAPRRVPVDPIWVLLREVTRNVDGPSEQRVAEGMEILKRLGAADHGYFANTPPARAVLARDLRRIDAGRPNILSHLAHHALAEHQKPRYFFEIEAELARCDLRFAGSTSTIRNEATLCLEPEFQDLYFGQEDFSVRELIKDYLLNENQRRDVYIKADSPDDGAAKDYIRANVHLFAMRPAAAILNRWNKQFQNWKIRHKPDDAAELVLECIDTGKNAFGDIENEANKRGDLSFEHLLRAFNFLLTLPGIHLCRKPPQSVPEVQFAMAAPERLAKERAGIDARSRMVVASPVLGGGLILGSGSTTAAEASSAGGAEDASADAVQSPDDRAARSSRKRQQDARLMSKLAQLEILA